MAQNNGVYFKILFKGSLVVLLFLISILFLPQHVKAQPAVSAWPTFHHDNQRTGRSPYRAATLEYTRWKYKTGGPVTASPVIDVDGSVYVGSWDNYFYAFDNFGVLQWRIKTGDIIKSSAAISQTGVIYVGSNDKKLYAFSRAGDILWTFETGGAVISSPAIGDDGTIYFGSADSKVYALNPDGTKKWDYAATTYGFDSSPSIGYDGRLYIGNWNPNRSLYGLNSVTGALEWYWPIPPWFFTPEEIAAGLFCFYGGIYAAPAIAPDGSIYVGNDRLNRGVACAPKTDYYYFRITPCVEQGIPDICGANFLVTAGEADLYSTAAVSQDASTFLGYGNNVVNFSPNGSLGWSYATNGTISYSSPALSQNSNVYIGSEDGFLYALTGNGSLVWKYETDGPILASPAIDSGGTIVFGSDDGTVYAVGGALCPLGKIFAGNAKSLGPFRNFRDDALNNSFKGRLFVKAYYLFAHEVISIFNKNPKLQHRALAISENILSHLIADNDAQKLTMTTQEMTDIASLLADMQAQSSPTLSFVIKLAKREINQKTWLNAIGVSWN
jgi:outer membrane protein assembly factor BamB